MQRPIKKFEFKRCQNNDRYKIWNKNMKTKSQIEEEKITPSIIGCMIPLLLLGCLFAYLFVKIITE